MATGSAKDTAFAGGFTGGLDLKAAIRGCEGSCEGSSSLHSPGRGTLIPELFSVRGPFAGAVPNAAVDAPAMSAITRFAEALGLGTATGITSARSVKLQKLEPKNGYGWCHVS